MKYLITPLVLFFQLTLYGQTTVSGAISSNTTWILANSPYEVTGNVTVEAGVNLTIEPGVTVSFTSNNFDLTIDGTLIADGTPDDSIYFQSNFASIFISSSSTGTIVDHARFEDMGAFNVAALHVSSDASISHSKFMDCEVGVTVAGGASPTIQHCTMVSSNDYGIRVDNGSPSISEVTIDGDKETHIPSGGIWIQSGSPSISQSSFSNIGTSGGIWVNTTDIPVIDNNTFSDNTIDLRTHPLLLDDTYYDNNGLSRIHVDPIDVTASTTWHKPQLPEDWVYEMMFGDITVTYGNTLTIEAGVTIEYTNNSQELLVQGALDANGTPTDSIRIRNGFATVELLSGSGPSTLQYIRMDGMGAFNVAGLVVNSSDVSISHSKFVDSEIGITVAEGASPTIQNCTIFSSSDYGIRIDGGAPTISEVVIDGDKEVHIPSGGIWIRGGNPNISGSTFTNIGTSGAIWVNTSDVPIIDNNTFSDNSRDLRTHPLLLEDTYYDNNGLSIIHVDPADVTVNTTWHKPQAPEDWVFEVLGQISVAEGVTLTMEPGFEINLNNYTHDIEVEGTLIANGTELDSIRINGPGGIDISENSTNSEVSYFRYQGVGATSSGSTDRTFGAGVSVGGSNATISHATFHNTMIGLAVYNDAEPSITESTFKESSISGFRSISGNATVTNSTFDEHPLYGVELQNGSVTFQNNTISNSSTGLYLNGVLTTPVIESNTFDENSRDIITHPELLDDELYDGNGLSRIYVNARTINSSTTWHKVESPETWEFHGLGRIPTANGVTLTVEPGFEINLNNYTHDIEVEGTLIANGTESDSIKINGPGGLDISENSSNSQVSYLRFEGVGATSSGSTDRTFGAGLSIGGAGVTLSNSSFLNTMIGLVVYNDAQPSISESTFDESSITGLRSISGNATVTNSTFNDHTLYGIEPQSGSITLQNNIISNSGTGLYINGVLSDPVIENNTFSDNSRDITTHPELLNDEFYDGNGFSIVYVNARTINNSTTWHKVEDPETWEFVGLGRIPTAAGITLTIEPGFEITLNSYISDIEVEGTLIANGTEADSIKINGPGGLDISENSANSEVSYLRFEGVGATSSGSTDRTFGGGLSIGGSNATISHSSFLSSAIAIAIYNDSDPLISSCEIATTASQGVRVVNGASSPTIENSCFYNNTLQAVQNLGTGTINASSNWWGDPSGPFNTAANPTGLGEEVSDGVTFNPWLTISPCVPPEITFDSQPASQTVCEGENAMLMVAASGANNLTYQWQQETTLGFENLVDDDTYTGATTNQLSILAPTSVLNSSVYRCIVSGDDAEDAISLEVELVVNTAATISSSSAINVTLCENETATFSVETSGVEPLSYSWYEGENLISNLTSQFTISNLVLTDENTYKVAVENECGSDSISFVLAVTDTVAITLQPENQSTVSGESLELSVEASGDGLNYQWQKDGNEIEGATDPTYAVSSAVKQDEGVYQCVVSNTCNSLASEEVTISVCVPVDISNQSSSEVTACEGEEHTFSIEDQGDAVISYEWYKDDVLISEATEAVYSLTDLSPSDGAIYKVIATNDCGMDSAFFQLDITLEPVIIQQPQDQTIDEGESVTFSLEAEGENISYQWQKNEIDIFGATTNSLSISSAQLPDAGDYRCLVINDCASITSSAVTLTVNEPLSIYETVELTIFPNPSYGQLHVHGLEADGDWTITITDLSGKKIIQRQLQKKDKELDVSELEKGVYLISIKKDRKRILNQRVIIH